MADDISREDYWAEIRSIVDEAKDEYRRHGDGDPQEWLQEYLHQTIDGHQWVIYTHYNAQVLSYSDNPRAYFDEIGEAPPGNDYSSMMAPLAFMAMERDVWDRIDLDDFDEDEDEDEDED